MQKGFLVSRKIRLPHVSWLVLFLVLAIITSDIFILIFGAPWSSAESHLRSLSGQTIALSGTIVEDPDTAKDKTSYRLNALCLGRTNSSSTEYNCLPTTSTVFVSGPVNRSLQRSDRVTLFGKMNDGFGIFAGTFYRPKITSIVRPNPGDVFLQVRDFFANSIRKHIPEEPAALGLGYLLGTRSSLPDGLDESLRTVGLTHIIVASGANLSILVSFSRKVFGKVSRLFGMICSILLVLFYVGMVGLSPSMVRAGIVSILSLLAWYVGRTFSPLRLLIIVAAATLLYNPMYLIDLGWLLSFGSFAGVMIVGPWLTNFFYGYKKPGLIGATLLETISASLVCTPILLYFFGTTSLISLLANLLVLPTISLAMSLCFITGIFSILNLDWLASLFGKTATWLLNYHLWIINFFGTQTSFLVTIPTQQWSVFLVYLPMLIIACVSHFRHRPSVENFSTDLHRPP